ncbi:Crossover junction endonuclease mus81 [Podila verticillata]|nr:Crossover junction endonuclease mus81 [Podila verticillata]
MPGSHPSNSPVLGSNRPEGSSRLESSVYNRIHSDPFFHPHHQSYHSHQTHARENNTNPDTNIGEPTLDTNSHDGARSTREAFATRFSDFVRSNDRQVDRPLDSYMDEDDQFQSVMTAIANIQMAPPGTRNMSFGTTEERSLQTDASAEILNADDDNSDSTVEDIYDLRHIMIHSQRQYEAQMASEEYSQYEPSGSQYSDLRQSQDDGAGERRPETVHTATSPFRTPSLSTAAAFAVESHMHSVETPPPPTMISSSYFSPTMESNIVLSSPPPGRSMFPYTPTPHSSFSGPSYSSTPLGNGPYRQFVTGRELGRSTRPQPQQHSSNSSMALSTTSDASDDLDAEGGRTLENSDGVHWSAYGSVTHPARSFEQHRLQFYHQQQHFQRQAFLEGQREEYSMDGIETPSDFSEPTQTPSRTHSSHSDPTRRAPHAIMSPYPSSLPYPSNIPIPSRYINPSLGHPPPHMLRPHNIATNYHHIGHRLPTLYDNDVAMAARYRRRLVVDGQPQPYSESVERAEAGGWSGHGSRAGASISSSTSTSTQYDNSLEGTHSRNNYLEIGLKEVVRMACRFCENIICERGMKAQLLADQAIGLFSTDDAPQSVQLIGSDYKPTNCSCRIRDTACLTCGNAIGYHITQPCEKCLMAENNGHLWLFHPEYIFSAPRYDPLFARQLRWEDLPNPEQDFDTLSIGKILQGGPNGRMHIGGMAYESMAKYPTPFIHPVEAMCLTGIGQKIVSQLETKLAEHCQANGLPMPTPKQAKAARRKAPLEQPMDDEKEPKVKRPRTQKPYVPGLRTGPYGILLCLLDAKLLDGEGALTKAQIIADGQIYCDCSLVNPDPGKFYTAWSSMKTLLEKNLVYQNASRYYMTEQGTEIAKLLRRSAVGVDPNVKPLDEPEEPQPVTRMIPSYSATASSSNSTASTRTPSSQSTVSSSSRLTTITSRTTSSIPPSSKPMSGIESSSISPSASKTRPSWQETDYEFDDDYGDQESAWSPTRDSTMARSRSACLQSITPQKTPSQRQTYSSPASYSSKPTKATANRWADIDQHVTVLSDDSEDDMSQDTSRSRASGSTLARHQNISFSAPTSTRSSSNIPSDDDFSGSHPPSRSKRPGNDRQPNASPVPVSNYDAFPHLKSASFEASGTQAADITSLARFQPIVFHPGTFDIVLILDIREIRGQSDRDYIGQKLMENGVQVEKRALDVGDVLWVARLKEDPIVGPSEIVLNYVIERKRMDDLVSSIKDGRFTEQKFRLKRSGIEHVIYLVESYKSDDSYEIGVEAIRTSQISTQVTDGFFVKRTMHHDQTIEYFTSVTKELKRLYLNKTLHAIPDRVVDRATYLDLQGYLKEIYPSRQYLTSYQAFCNLNSKSNAVAVRDVFVKMLMTIRGISAEKATEIARTYGTPRRMFSNLDEGGTSIKHTERRKKISRSNTGAGRKKIGLAASARIADIWYLEEPPN